MENLVRDGLALVGQLPPHEAVDDLLLHRLGVCPKSPVVWSVRVYGRIQNRIRDLVRRRCYVMTTHAEEEADEAGLGILDIESVLLAGAIVERQRDRETREWKYAVHGETLDGREAIIVAKSGRLAASIF